MIKDFVESHKKNVERYDKWPIPATPRWSLEAAEQHFQNPQIHNMMTVSHAIPVSSSYNAGEFLK